jgi:hypothetical protein
VCSCVCYCSVFLSVLGMVQRRGVQEENGAGETRARQCRNRSHHDSLEIEVMVTIFITAPPITRHSSRTTDPDKGGNDNLNRQTNGKQ